MVVYKRDISLRYAIIAFFMVGLLCMISGCGETDDDDDDDIEFGNPYDEDNPDYVPPSVVITAGPENGSTVNTAKVAFEWKRDELPTEYSYWLAGADRSEWSIEINTGVAIGNPPGVDGSGAIAEFTFKALGKGETIIDIEGKSEIRSSDNSMIPMNKMINGTVII